MRGILIDPVMHSVRYVDYDGNYKDIYRLLEIESPFDVRPISGTENESIFFDDEFLLKADEGGRPGAYFYMNGIPDPIGGRGLILGCTEEGESVETKLTVEDVRQNVRWKALTLKGFTPPRTEEKEHPVMGKTTVIIGPRPIFEEEDVLPEQPIEDVVRNQSKYASKKEAMSQVQEYIRGVFKR